MPGFSNYPLGFPQGITIRGVPINVTNPGKTFWLYNGTALMDGCRGGSDQNKGTFQSPFSTLSGAVAQCVAARGDIIMVKAGHAESISSSTALTMSKSGVAVVGQGTGDARPTFTIDTANTATINVTAANVSFVNCKIVGNFLSIAAAFLLTTAKNFTLQNCLLADTSSVLNFLNGIKSTGGANTIDGLTVLDCQWSGLGTTSVNSFILTANTIDKATIRGNRVILNRTADASIMLTATAGILTNLDFGDNIAVSQQTASTAGSLINVGGTTSTGAVYRNFAGTLVTSGDIIFTTTVGLYPFENYVSGVVGASGFIIPARDS